MIIHPTIKFCTNHNKFKPSHYTLHVQVLPKVHVNIVCHHYYLMKLTFSYFQFGEV